MDIMCSMANLATVLLSTRTRTRSGTKGTLDGAHLWLSSLDHISNDVAVDTCIFPPNVAERR